MNLQGLKNEMKVNRCNRLVVIIGIICIMCILNACSPTEKIEIQTEKGDVLRVISMDTFFVDIVSENSIHIRSALSDADLNFEIVDRDEVKRELETYEFIQTSYSYISVRTEDEKEYFTYLRPFIRDDSKEMKNDADYWMVINEIFDEDKGLTTTTLNLYDDYKDNYLDLYMQCKQ